MKECQCWGPERSLVTGWDDQRGRVPGRGSSDWPGEVETGVRVRRQASEAAGRAGPPRRELSGAENSTRGNTLGREKEVKQSNGLFPSVRFRGRKC